ncbi:MAG: NAD-dependent epimerase/dehydratase family protein [Marinilabiliales bacterium]|nr:NAD-dependent epimerase/dehydratase family protein [Marinilabiliales bacterium]
MQTILGANGTIGKLLAKELMSYTDRVRLVSRNPIRINETDELLPADLTQPGAVERAVRGSEVVYLVVGFEYKAKVWEEKWPLLMKETIDACIKHGAKLVFFDNVYMYDRNQISHMTEETVINPPSRKGDVRKRISEMLMTASGEGLIKALIARSADFYGPDTDNNFITQMVLKNLKDGQKAYVVRKYRNQSTLSHTRPMQRRPQRFLATPTMHTVRYGICPPTAGILPGSR